MAVKKTFALLSSLIFIISSVSCGIKNSNTSDLPAETSVSSAVTVPPATEPPVTEPPVTESTTEPPVTEDPIKKELEKEACMNIYNEMAYDLSQAYKVFNGHSIGTTVSECLVCNPFTVDIYYKGPVNEINPEIYSQHPVVLECRLLEDGRFSSNEELFEFLHRFFTDDIIRERTKRVKPFLKYEGRYYYVHPLTESDFEGFRTDGAEIYDIVPEESFSINVFSDSNSDEDNSIPRFTLKFKNTDDGWRVSEIKDKKSDISIPE